MYDKASPGFFGANGPYAQLYCSNAMVLKRWTHSRAAAKRCIEGQNRLRNMNLAVAGLALITAVLSFGYVGYEKSVRGSCAVC